MKKLGRIVIPTIVAVVILTVWMIKVAVPNMRNQDASVRFLPSYGTVQYDQEGRKALSLAFLAGKNFRGADSESTPIVEFPGQTIAAKNIELVKAVEYNGYALWYLHLDLEMDSTVSNAKTPICELDMDGNTYPIGLLNIHVIDSDEEADHLTMSSRAAASLGLGAAPYHVKMENTGTKALEISGLSDDAYQGAKVTVEKNDNERPTGLPISLDAGDTVWMDMDFSGCNREEAAVYYVSPTLTYTCDGQTYQMQLGYYTSGMSLSKQEVKALCNQYMEEKH